MVHVVRCFDNDDIVHVEGSVDPARDIETINLELIFADMEMVERRIDRVSKMLKGDKGYAQELAVLKRLLAHLESGRPARSMETTEEESALLKEVSLLSAKPVIYACNLSEEDFSAGIASNERIKTVEQIAGAEGAEVLPICAGMEAELAGMDEGEKRAFLADLGLERSGLDRLIQSCYQLLGLISYLTAGKPEVRAWTITRGTRAPQAAGKIHSDFERGFIRAEVIGYDEFMACGGSMTAAKKKGWCAARGKNTSCRMATSCSSVSTSDALPLPHLPALKAGTGCCTWSIGYPYATRAVVFWLPHKVMKTHRCDLHRWVFYCPLWPEHPPAPPKGIRIIMEGRGRPATRPPRALCVESGAGFSTGRQTARPSGRGSVPISPAGLWPDVPYFR